MFSKSIDHAPAWSITARLTALFTISTSLLVLVVVGILYEAIARHLDEEHEHLVAEIVRVLKHSGASPARSVTSLVEQIQRIEANEPASYSDPYEVRVVDAHGHVLAESRRMSIVPVTAFSRGSRPLRWSSPNGESFLISTIDAADSGGAAPGSVVQVALNVTRDRILMNELRTTAVVLVVVALFAAAIAGSAVVRYSLRPVGRIASEVAGISPKDLERRLPLSDRPRELGPLVGAFNTMLDRLEHAFTNLSEYSENLAHELRTPLNNLKGEAEVALLHDRGAEEYREVLMSSLEEYDRLSTMADGLLFLARAESRKTKPSWSVIRLSEKARAVCELYEGIADEEKATLIVEGNASLNADPVLVGRALSNLIANALGHIHDGGHVRIVIAQMSDGGAAIDVIDDGRGIAAADLPHVFERFYRSSETRSSRVHGSGLGLAIVKSIMDLHGGSVAIKSEPGKGTTVTLQFPANMTSV